MPVRFPLAAPLATAAAVIGAPAAAVPLAVAAGEYTLSAVGGLPDGVAVDLTGSAAGTDPAPASNVIGDGVADAQASSDLDAGDLGALLTGAVLAEAEADLDSFADAAAFASGLLVLVNEGAATTVDFVLDYDLSGAVQAMGLDEAAEAQVTLDLDFTGAEDGPDALFFEELTLDALEPGSDAVPGQFAFSVDLAGAGAFSDVEITLQATARAENLAPIPLPAGLPLAALGLGALALLRRRA